MRVDVPEIGPEVRERNKQQMYSLLRLTGRDGIEELIAWLDKMHVELEPASAKYHNDYAGGLVAHLLSVYSIAEKLVRSLDVHVPTDSLVIVCLLHDLSKIGTYKIAERNIPSYGTNGTKIWTKVNYYLNDYEALGKQSLPHGTQSAFLAQQFIKLTPDEFFAIHNHMGPDASNNPSEVYNAYKNCALAQILHYADGWSTCQLEYTFPENEIIWR